MGRSAISLYLYRENLYFTIGVWSLGSLPYLCNSIWWHYGDWHGTKGVYTKGNGRRNSVLHRRWLLTPHTDGTCAVCWLPRRMSAIHASSLLCRILHLPLWMFGLVPILQQLPMRIYQTHAPGGTGVKLSHTYTYQHRVQCLLMGAHLAHLLKTFSLVQEDCHSHCQALALFIGFITLPFISSASLVLTFLYTSLF